MDADLLAALVRSLYEVCDRPCEKNGNWPHVAKWRALDTRLRAAVGAPPRKDD